VLKRMPDLDKIIAKLTRLKYSRKHNCSLADCYKVYSAFKGMQGTLWDLMEMCADEAGKKVVSILVNIDHSFSEFYKMIEDSVDLDRVNRTGECFINPNCSEELTQIQQRIDECHARIESLRSGLEKVLERVGLIYMHKAGWVFEAQKDRATNHFRTSDTKFNILTTRKNTVCFSNRELTSLSNEIEGLQKSYQERQQKFIERVFMETITHLELIEAANIAVVEQDILSGFAELYLTPSQGNAFCLAQFEGEGGMFRKLEVKNSWHLCVKNCVANSVELSSETHTALVLTGPNMGGKSTLIRQVAVCALLAHVGCPVPASACHLTRLSSIYTRVGASDIQLKGISTFMNEMIETASLLSSATKDSLLIIDELGRGTSIIEGRALAQAILEHILLQKTSLCLFATHFFELTKLVERNKSIKNCNMEVVESGSNVVFTYKVREGAVEKSFGISLIDHMGYPREIVEEARKICQRLEQK
jgi:DNA mismatch repair protein MSH2